MIHRFHSLRSVLPALLATMLFSTVLISTAQAADDPYKETREAFLRAYARVDQGTAEADQVDSERLRDYPLYPYLQAARIRRALLTTTDTPGSVAASSGVADSLGSVDQRAATFLAYYAREPVARDVRRAWLASLAERQQWPVFLDQYREEATNDALRCQRLVARIGLERTDGLAADIAKHWLTPQSLPECERPFAWLREHNALTPALIEQRARLALENGNTAFARQIIAELPSQQAAPLTQWAALLDNPQRGIDGLIGSPNTQIDPATLLAGWTRLARRDRAAAVARYDALIRARGMDEKSASPYALALALSLSWDRDPDALQYFAKVQAADLDDNALEWQTRAALWLRDWALVSRSIAAMSDANRQTARWRYWAGRAAEQTRDLALARQLYTSVLIDDNYYSAMAGARLDQPVVPHPEKLVVDRTQLREIGQLPAFVRARELLLSSLRREAVNEWQSGYESLSENARKQAIHLAADWGWYDQAVATASQQLVFNDYALLYPRPFDREVRAAAKLTRLEPELIYGVLRQESLYRTDAVSAAGAHGLLQLLPETARRTARRWKRPRPTASDLFNPSINVALGARQLRILIDKFDGQTAVALAGYNAGPAAAARWLPADSIDPDIWVENIPFNETRGYVQRVLWHSVVFAWLRSGEAQRTDRWLARIGPPADPAVLETL